MRSPAPSISAHPANVIRSKDIVPFAVDFDRAPFLVIWEVTRACALACIHCRADAIARRAPRELSTEEGFSLIDQVRSFGTPPPVLVLTGGDPMWRKDLADLVGYATKAGLTVALTPSGTAMPTRARLAELKDAGLSRVAVSLDGPDPETHDAFRRVKGSYAYTVKIIESVIELGLPLQINTTVSRVTLPTLRTMAERVSQFPLTLWAVFFLILTGRGAGLEQITAEECEGLVACSLALHDRMDVPGCFHAVPEEAAGGDPLKTWPRMMHPHRVDDLSLSFIRHPRVVEGERTHHLGRRVVHRD